MDWLLSVAGEALAAVLAAAVLAALGWIGSSIRDLRREISDARAQADTRLDRAEKQLVKVEELERHDVIKRLGAVEMNLAKIEERCLGEGSLDRIHERVDQLTKELTKEVHSLGGKLESMSGAVGMIQDYLLNKGAGK